MFDTVVTGIGVLSALCLVGFMALKTIAYGGVITGILTIDAPLVSRFTGTDVFALMLSRLLAMFAVFPPALGGAASVMRTHYDLLGILDIGIISGPLAVPCWAGILCGVYYWPESNVLWTTI